MVIARMAHDGYMDLVVAPVGEPVLRIYQGHGDGTFEPPFDYPFEHGGNQMVARDLNGDGLSDIAIPVAGTVQVLLATPGSWFQAPRVLSIGHTVDGLVAGDINADRDVDLVALDVAEGKFSIMLNDGLANFSTAWQPAPGIRGPACMGRLDGDAFVDLAIVSGSGVATWRGTVDGTLSSSSPLGSGPWPIDGIVAADLDGDGIDEVVTSARSFVVVHHGSPAGPESNYDFFGVYHSAGPLVAGRFDGDLHADVCTLEPTATGGIPECDPSPGTLAYVWHGNESGGFAHNPALTALVVPTDILVADFDRDGAVDVVSESQSRSAVEVHRGRQDGTFDPPVATSLPNVEAMVAIEAGRGDPLEIAAAQSATPTTSSRILILSVDANGALVTRQTIPSTESPSVLVAADFNADGRQDLAATFYSGRSIRVFLADANGFFDDGPLLPLPFEPQALISADLDRDGFPDLATGGALGFFGGSLLVLLGAGNGEFSVRDSVSTPYPVNAIAVSAHPGIDPLLAVSANPPSCLGSYGFQMLFRSVEGVLARLGFASERATSPLRLAFADVDGDGRDDLLSANAYGALSIQSGLPGAAFGEPTIYGAGNSIFTFQVTDYDHDGRPDVFLGERYAVRILRNVGARTTPWTTTASRLGGGLTEAILVRGRNRTVTLLIAGDPEHDARRIVPESVRLAGAPALEGRSGLRDEVGRLRPVDDACIALSDGADGFADLSVTFSSLDVFEGWRRSHDAEPPGLVALDWDARTVDGSAVAGQACALVVAGDGPEAATMGAFGPDTRSDLGVGVTLDLPVAALEATVSLFDVAGRRVATLHRGGLEAGFHRLPWSEAGARPGIYFAQARVDGAVLKTRLVILR
jgi:hypothetical protein